MFRKVLVANRGEIAVRAFRAAYELGVQTVAVFPYEDRNAVHRIKADEAYQIGERGHPVRAYLDIEEIIRAAQMSGADAIYPGYGFLSENPDLARACDAAGITFIGPPADVLQLAGNKVRALGAAKAAGHPHPEVHPTVVRSRRPAGRRGGDRLPGLRQGGRRRRRPRHAPGGRPAAELPESPERGHARGRGRLRRSDRVHRAGGGPAAAHRGTDPGRYPWQRHAPVRAGLLHPAPAPEGGGDRSGPQHHRGTARSAVRRRDSLRAFAQLFLCRHGRVPGGDRGRTGRPARLHRDEPADPGRAHRHRGDHRRRSGPVPDADRLRRIAGRSRPVPGHGPDQRRGPAVPDHHRGPGQRIPSRHRHHHRLPHRRRSRRPAGRRHRRHRRRGQCPFRLDARQADLPGSNLRSWPCSGPGVPWPSSGSAA